MTENEDCGGHLVEFNGGLEAGERMKGDGEGAYSTGGLRGHPHPTLQPPLLQPHHDGNKVQGLIYKTRPSKCRNMMYIYSLYCTVLL